VADQPFLNYNLPGGWYLTTSPIITANIMAEGSQCGTVPLGAARAESPDRKDALQYSAAGILQRGAPGRGTDWSIRFKYSYCCPSRKRKNDSATRYACNGSFET
jgi:hypothetical protein